MAYTQVFAGSGHTLLLRSDGSVVAIGDNRRGQCNIPPLDEGMTYTQVSAGGPHTVFLRSDDCAVAIGDNSCGQCNIPPLPAGMTYTHIAAGFVHTVLLRSDGSVVAIGGNESGHCNISLPGPGIRYVGDTTRGRDLVLQLEIVYEEDTVTLICSTAGGEERCRLIAQSNDSAWDTHKRMARELNPGFAVGNFLIFPRVNPPFRESV